MIHDIALWIGYVVLCCGGIAIVSGMIIGASILANRASHHALETVGGWKVFMEYREWYWHERPKNTQTKEGRG